jgi:hypothetical protein
MHAYDLDQAHRARYELLLKGGFCDRCITEGQSFSNAHVAALYRGDKVLLPRFNREEILSTLPFAPTLFVSICPKCITGSNIEVLKALCKADLMVPILSAPYQRFPAPVVDCIAGLNHVSYWEFHFHRAESLLINDRRCRCHVRKEEASILARAPRRNWRSRQWNRVDADLLFENLHPYVGPDEEILTLVKRHLKAKRTAALHHLSVLSYTIREVRTAQAFNAALVAKNEQLDSMPPDIMTEVDETRRLTLSLKSLAMDGLGLRLPDSIPIRPYIELIRDFRGRLDAMADAVLDLASNEEGLVNAPAICNTLADLNNEIERVQRLRRYIVWESAFGVVRGALQRVIPVAAATAGIRMFFGGKNPAKSTLAKRRGAPPISNVEPFRDILVPRVLRYLQPYLDKARTYAVGSNFLAMQVMSARRHLGKVAASAIAKRTVAAVDDHWHFL